VVIGGAPTSPSQRPTASGAARGSPGGTGSPSVLRSRHHVHRPAGIGLHTPASVHYRTATEIRGARAATLTAAYEANPARFRHRPPTPPKFPEVAWIGEPDREALIQSA